MKTKRLFISLTLGLGLTLALLWLLGGALPAYADPDILYVATDGDDAKDCSTIPNRCRTVQRAVDLAVTGDEIWVAGGVYTDADTSSLGYVVTLNKTVILRGGWDASFTTQDFDNNPSTLDGQGQGRVLFITGDISPTVEGLRITGGDAAGLGGAPGGNDAGGGVYVVNATATLSNNQVFSNTADYGGGLYLEDSDDATLSGNTAISNMANYGGGLYLLYSAATLSANIFSGNTADSNGGGLFLAWSDATLTNNVVADNQANTAGSGLYMWASSPRLLHTTIARNSGGDGSGVVVDTIQFAGYQTAVLTNTILVSQTVGITVTDGNTALLERTLWGSGAWANGADTGGAGTIITGTHNYWDHPTFVDPGAGDYHIGPGSAAIDAGVDAGVTVDIDGESRPVGAGYDLGADEFPAALNVTKEAAPDPVQAGAQLTYTIYVTNTGNVALTATVTDTLPDQVSPTGVLTWMPPAIAPDDVWVEQFTVTVQMGYSGTLTNVVEVTTEEGAAGVYTETAQARVTPMLEVTKEADPDPVQAGAQLTYTISVTNTGNVALTAAVTDTLPDQVSPTGVLTWTPPAIAPNDFWEEQFTVTVQMGYSGTLSNVVEVTTEEGAAGVYTETSQAQVTPMLEVSKEADPDPVQAGAQLTYTIYVTNTGNVTLTAAITDVLPAHVTPTGVLTWRPTITAPDGVWTWPVVVTVETDYAGTLTNVVQVTTDEGATGVYIETTTAVNCFARLNDEPTIYPTVQEAVDASTQPTDVVKVAGYCSIVNTYGGLAQVAYISKTLTVHGGYTTTNWTTPYPITQPTTLDAQGNGRVIYITGDINPIIEGLRITGGDADGLGGAPWGDAGGGGYIITATATISKNQVFNNTADYGGGLYLEDSDATLINNTITSNTAHSDGGGLYLENNDNATLISNNVASNTATNWGGGLYLGSSDATLSGNTVISNTAEEYAGGGLHLDFSAATLSGNTVISNTADAGGGLYLSYSDGATLSGNTVISNTANGTVGWDGRGGGLFLFWSDTTLTNNVVADNQTSIAGSGLYIWNSSSRLLHTTIARNIGGDGSGIHIATNNTSTAALTNTILASHSVGISVTGGNTVTVNSILWHGTPITVSQSTTATVTVQNQHQGDPAFAADGYHLTAGSAAIDQGMDAGVTADIDGQSRPIGMGYDLGADEFPAALKMTKEPDQTVIIGSDATFTLTITNVGDMTLTDVTVTDTLAPDCVKDDIGSLAPTQSMSYTCVVTDVMASFTNTAMVTGTSPAGTVNDTDTATVTVADIKITKEPDQTVVSGSDVTFTLTVTNTGDADLTTVTVTDAWAPDCDASLGSLAPTESVSYTCQVADVMASFTNTATVAGTSPAGTVNDTDTATVTVEEAVDGLVATNDSPTSLGSVTTLTATITAGSNVTYNWAFGDGNTGSGAVVTHIYPDVGVYTAIVTASNSVSMLTATTPVTITDTLIKGLVANNDSPTVLGQATTLTATITGGSNVVYTWALGDGDTGSGAVVVHTYPATGTYTAVVTASNSVSVRMATTPVTIIEALKLYLPIILKDYAPPPEPPTATPTSTSPPPTATPTSTSPPPTATPTSTSPAPTGPDLVVTDISVVPDPPEAGQSATVYVTVKNQGNQAVAYDNNFYVDFYVDREPAPLLPGDIEWGVQFSWFGAGESYTLNGSYTFTEGTHQLWGQADTDNTVVEAYENNNVLGPVTLDVTSLGGGEAPTRPVIIPTPGAGSPRPTPSPAP